MMNKRGGTAMYETTSADLRRMIEQLDPTGELRSCGRLTAEFRKLHSHGLPLLMARIDSALAHFKAEIAAAPPGKYLWQYTAPVEVINAFRDLMLLSRQLVLLNEFLVEECDVLQARLRRPELIDLDPDRR